MKAILFDIDGTILNTKGAGRDSLMEATSLAFGTTGKMEIVDFQGRTDQYILTESLRHTGMTDDDIEEKLPVLKDLYFSLLKENMLTYECYSMPGIEDLLQKLSTESDFILGLLTGNFRESAYIKIGRFGLEGFFSMGVFADDAARRNDMPPIARERIRELHGVDMDFSDIIIIGDTVHDIECARASGAVAVAVGTGWTPGEELIVKQPDYYFDDLGDTELVMDVIKGI